MATTSFNYQEEQLWRGYVRAFINIFRGASARGGDGDPPSFNLWGENPGFEDNHTVREAILALRMAGRPGESFPVVAERVEKEAADYKEFLQNPGPIGKISLRVKQILAAPDAGKPSGGVYQVRDPAEGKASVFYTFNRSDTTVLEFIVHDEYDRPLFPVVRTYSNWLGKRSFSLGRDRVFSLRMTEGGCPDVVRVQASFVSAQEEEFTGFESGSMSRGLPLAPDVEGASYAARDIARNFPIPYGRRLGLIFGAQCVVAILFAGWFFWQTGRPDAKQNPEPFVYPATVEVIARSGGRTEFLITSPEEALAWAEGGSVGRPVVVTKSAEEPNISKLARKAVLAAGPAAATRTSAHTTGGRCGELFANLRKAVSDIVHFMAVPAPAASWPHGGQSGKALAAADAYFGRVRVTFLVRDGLLPLEGRDCFGDEGDGEGGFASNSRVMFLRGTLADVLGGDWSPSSERSENQPAEEIRRDAAGDE